MTPEVDRNMVEAALLAAEYCQPKTSPARRRWIEQEFLRKHKPDWLPTRIAEFYRLYTLCQLGDLSKDELMQMGDIGTRLWSSGINVKTLITEITCGTAESTWVA